MDVGQTAELVIGLTAIVCLLVAVASLRSLVAVRADDRQGPDRGHR